MHPERQKDIDIAMVCHAANTAWCKANNEPAVSWEDAPEWQKDSAMAGVHFRRHNPDAGHDAQHNAWLKQKENDGWVYGEVKDPEAKTHPCIVPYDQLPEFQKKKDALFCAIVDALK